MSLKKLAKLAIMIGVWVVVPLFLVEVLMITLDPYLFKGRFEYDPDLGFRGRAYYRTTPGFMGDDDDGAITNRFGFNAPDYSLQKAPGTFRVLFVGDSFSWAGGLKGNYTALLGRMFEARHGFPKVEVVNTGYPGTHTGEQLLMLKKYGLQYNPDLDRRAEHHLFGYPIILQSRLRLFLTQRYEVHKIQTQARKEAQEWSAATGQPAPTKNLPQEIFYRVQEAKLKFCNKNASERFESNIDFVFRSITEMNDLLKARNIKFMVAIYPDSMQVSPAQFDALVTKYGLKREDYDLNRAQDRLQAFLTSKQIPFVDFMERFKAEEQKRDLYLFNDPHWNKAGNQLAAEMLFQYLTKQPFDFNKPK
jgi:lysophospholipase L1-like esterase